MAQYLVPERPRSDERGSYARAPTCFFWDKPGPFVWLWRPSIDVPAGTRARVRINGVPGPWVTANASDEFSFEIDGPDGHYEIGGEVEGYSLFATIKEFVICRDGVPTDAPVVGATRFDHHYGPDGVDTGLPAGADRAPNVTALPKTWPFKARVIEPYSTALSKSELYVRAITQNIGAAMTRRFVDLPKRKNAPAGEGNAVVVEPMQKYFYNDATALGNDIPGENPPVVYVRDGPRGVGALGFVAQLVIRRGGNGFYFIETSGRIGFCSLVTGSVSTLCGWRLKPGVRKIHGGVLSPYYMYGKSSAEYRPEHRAEYDARYEHLGDWSQVTTGPQRMHEAWALCVALRKPDGTIDDRDGHDIWFTDTLCPSTAGGNGRILFMDHWTAHQPDHFEPSHFPPANYVQAPGPTGKSTVCVFYEGPLCQGPWGIAFNPQDEHVYWSNFNDGSICRKHATSGAPAEVVFRTAQVVTDGMIGLRERLGFLTQSGVTATRTAYLRDGPQGTAILHHAQAIAFSPDYQTLYIASRYEYSIRKLSLATRELGTLWLNPKVALGSTSAATNDATLAVDDGTTGALGDVLYQAWHDSDHRIGADGTYKGRVLWTSGAVMRNGPLHLCEAPGYAWPIACGDGRIVSVGNAAGWQFVEVTKRQPSDGANPDLARWKLGRRAFNDRLGLTHGPDGTGEIGYPYIDELGSWDDATLGAYLAQWGVSSAAVPAKPYTYLEAAIYYVRWQTRDLDYSAPPPLDAQPPAAPAQATVLSATFGAD